MLKNILIVICSLTLMSCQENHKSKIQELIDKKDFVTAKIQVEEMLGQKPNDAYFNGAMGYILSVECVSTNCSQNSPDRLKKIKYYLTKSNGLAGVDEVYFVDFYQEIIKNMVVLAVSQEKLEDSKLTLKEFVNPTNPRINFIYNELYSLAIKDLLTERLKESSRSFELLQELNFKLNQEQKVSIDLLMSFERNKPLSVMKDKIKAFNRVFIGRKLPNEFLVALSPVIVEYALSKKLDSIVEILEDSVKSRSTILGENVAVLRQADNVNFYAKGVELTSESDIILEHLVEEYGKTKEFYKTALQNISLKLNPDNKDLWVEYVKLLLETDNIKQLYENINIERLESVVVILNNNLIMDFAKKKLATGSIIPLLNEIVFREDSNKDFYTNQTVALVEQALKLEISKNNLEGIFEYLNYIPSVKEKFKDELNSRLEQYISAAWASNNFKNLNRLIALHKDLNGIKDNSMITKLYEGYLLQTNSQKFFKAVNIQEFITFNKDLFETAKDMKLKYTYVADKLKMEELQSTLFSVVRKMEGLYTQAKLFSYYADSFSAEKRDDLIVDAVASSLEKDEALNLNNLISLAGFLLNKTDRVPENFIKDYIAPRIKDVDDITNIWKESSPQTKNLLISYNPDIKNLISVIENDKANKKITASTYISKIKSPEILKFVEKYKNIYKSYVDQIVGYYVQETGDKGPEIVKITKAEGLLKVQVEFVSRLGKIENLDKYKLDRGEVIAKAAITYYNPVKNTITLKSKYTSKELKVFNEINTVNIKSNSLMLGKQKYKKVKDLFELNKRYGITKQITQKAKDNFHILPEGSSLTLVKKISDKVYGLKIHHPAMPKPVVVNATYLPATEEFEFNYNYTIKLLEKTFSAKAKCQFIDTKAYCAVQDKYWKRASYSIILKALQVK